MSETRDDATLHRIHAAGWPLPGTLWERLSPAERAFAEHELCGLRTVAYYRRRIAALGFLGFDTVLDLGCGIGQWSCVLAEGNRRVTGVDPNGSRLAMARTLAGAMGLDNCAHAAARAETLPLPDGSVDAVFCYGVFMFTEMPGCLREAHRVLRSGGRIYLNANSWGWYAHLLIDRGIRRGDWGMARTALAMTTRAFSGASTQMLVRRDWLHGQVRAAGLRILASGQEGDVVLDSAVEPPEPAYPRRFYGLPAILELVAEKA
ncbi:methyltransferase domain-containing protein [Azospirillum himalayense]|uniref:Methyltransferase domain-containing protein n=1 Tax=Azospirillum himalayense TaxID=654847 RepID=A0ABW0FZX1_9PROT